VHLLRTMIVALLAAATCGSLSHAAELQMYRRDGCPWCRAWDREVGPIYGKTDLGRRIPLRMVDLDRERPAAALKSPIIYTPTFVLVEGGREIGRIQGYPGDSFFWGLLDRLVEQLNSGLPDGRTALVRIVTAVGH
jgi:hypothetical protein